MLSHNSFGSRIFVPVDRVFVGVRRPFYGRSASPVHGRRPFSYRFSSCPRSGAAVHVVLWFQSKSPPKCQDVSGAHTSPIKRFVPIAETTRYSHRSDDRGPVIAPRRSRINDTKRRGTLVRVTKTRRVRRTPLLTASYNTRPIIDDNQNKTNRPKLRTIKI